MEAFESRSRRTSGTTRSFANRSGAIKGDVALRPSVGALLVAILLYSAWQHFELIRYGYRIEQMQKERAARRADQPPPEAEHPDA